MRRDRRRLPRAAALCCLVTATAPILAAGLELRTSHPGHLFPHGTKVAVRVAVERDTPLGWHVTDVDGKERAAGALAPGDGSATIEVGELPRGYYELTVTKDDVPAKLSFGVVTDRSAHPPRAGRLNVDGATSWLEKRGRHETLARMLRRIGVRWVRERFSWAGTEPEPEQVRWDPYDQVADAFTRQGVQVYQIFHDSPRWSHAGKKNTRNPDDLRDVYRFTKRLAVHYKGRVQAWEVWNEPDIFFWPDLADTFAGVQKAAYLGFKRGDPELAVLLGSFCRGYSAFDENLFETGIREYFDIFNWHTYAAPDAYPATLRRYRELLERYDASERPVWLTEAGIRLRATEPGGELGPADERRQADFVPKSLAWSLAAGTDRHFFFVLPYYLERGIQFGALRQDLSPRPGLIAIAAAVDLLGEARYLGRYPTPDPDRCPALAFHNGEQPLVVVWSDSPQTVRLEVDSQRVLVADVVGQREWRDTTDGELELALTSSPRYVVGLGPAALTGLRGTPRATGQMPTARPHPLVIRGQARVDTIDKQANCYRITDAEFRYTVEVCNLDERTTARGRVWLEAPGDWRVAPEEVRVSLEPMGRAVAEVVVTPGRPSLRTHKLWIRATVEDGTPHPSVSYFAFDLSRMPPAGSLDLALGDASRWQRNISGNGSMEIRSPAKGEVRFETRFSGPGDRWAFPRASFSPAADVSAYEGIRFEYRTDIDDDQTFVRLQVIETGGPAYFTTKGWKAQKEWTDATCLFRDLAWGSFSRRDANGRLDLGAVAALLVGLNTPDDRVSLEVRNLRLVKWSDRESDSP